MICAATFSNGARMRGAWRHWVITLAAERDGAQAQAARHVLDALELSVGTAALPSELRGQLAAQATA